MDYFSANCDAFGLRINLRETKVLLISQPGFSYKEPTTIVKNTRLKFVDSFAFFGSSISMDGVLASLILKHTKKESVSFFKL